MVLPYNRDDLSVVNQQKKNCKKRKNVSAINVLDDIADLERSILRWTVYLKYRISKINVYI